MKIRLTKDLPIEKKHGCVKGKEYEVIEITHGRRGKIAFEAESIEREDEMLKYVKVPIVVDEASPSSCGDCRPWKVICAVSGKAACALFHENLGRLVRLSKLDEPIALRRCRGCRENEIVEETAKTDVDPDKEWKDWGGPKMISECVESLKDTLSVGELNNIKNISEKGMNEYHHNLG